MNTAEIQKAVVVLAGLFMPYIQEAVKEAVADVIAQQEEAHNTRTVSRAEGSKLLNVSLVTFDKLINDGVLTPIKIGRRVVVAEREINELLASGKNYKYSRKNR